jgi:hypothetical protein
LSHPYNEHRDHKVQHSRVHHIAKGHASGGRVEHSDAAEDRKMVKAMVRPGALKEHGGAAKHRADRPNRARGGRTGKKHSGKTVVNVITHGGPVPAPPTPGGPPGAGAPPITAPVPAPPPRPPMAGPPGPPGPGPMPPMMPRARGGRVGATKGDSTKPAPTGGGGDGPAFKEGVRSGTHVSHSPNKDDAKDIGRGKAITYAKGGKVPQTPTGTGNAGGGRRLVSVWAGGSVPGRKTGGRIYSEKGPMAPEFEGGAGGGEARLEKAKRARSHYKAA